MTERSAAPAPRWWGNFVGAFADGAILFPLLAALSLTSGFSATLLLGSAGAAYICAGILFRVPMSVQPLKAIAIGAIAVGASAAEVRLSGAFLGAFCLVFAMFDADRIAQKIPKHFIHGIQLALGIILLLKGAQLVFDVTSPAVFFNSFGITLALAGAMVAAGYLLEFPLLGVVATLGLAWTILFEGPPAANNTLIVSTGEGLRPAVIASLVLPQLVLTSANSVVATKDVARRYFGETAAFRVTIKRLFCSIGIGNLISSAIGGLPFCHGSGGVTAHVKGGANHWSANLVVGSVLLGFSIIQLMGGQVALNFPLVLLSSLLAATGIFHMGLAKPSWDLKTKRPTLCVMAAVAVLTFNMFWVLLAGIAVEFFFSKLQILKKIQLEAK